MHVARSLALTLLLTSCGARSQLIAPDASTDDASDAIGSFDARDRTEVSDGFDTLDAADAFDAPDVTDAAMDSPPPICVDGGVTFIYVITLQNTLYSYYPPLGTFQRVGVIVCPVDPSVNPAPTPYSMSVDRSGTAYVVFNDGHLFLVSTATASCRATPFVVGQHGFTTFGMGFTANRADPGESLYVAESDFMGPSQGLATIDTRSLSLNIVNPFSQSLGRTELTGTGDGRLFGFSLNTAGSSDLTEIDPANARVLRTTRVAVGNPSDAFAFAFWGGDFYVFTAPGSTSTVTRFRPSDGSLRALGTLDEIIVGAGVSTCAPH